MAQESELTLVFILSGLVLLFIYLYITTIEKVLERVGFTKGEASSILFLTLFFGWVTIPIFPHSSGWWIGMSLGGAIIPIMICVVLLKSRRVPMAEGFIGLVIVATIAYFITRAEEGVGIVADIPWAFMPAVAAGLYSVSTFWTDVRRAAPLAYFSGVTGTLVGADVFHLQEILSYPPSEDSTFSLLSIGGANIFDMVYITGIAAVLVGVLIFWYDRQRRKLGFENFVMDWRAGAEGLPYARDPSSSRTQHPDRKGRL
jgi:uncharacterized membrane protein